MSEGNNDPRIIVLQEQLTKVKMHPTERDALADDLKYAHDINGDTAPVMQMLKTMFIQNVRRELLAIARAETHYKNCLVAGQIGVDKNGNPLMPWDKMLETHIEQQHAEDPEQEAIEKELKDAREALAKQKEVEAEMSTISWGKLSLKGPVTRLAVACMFIVGVVWVMLNFQDATLRKDLNDKIVPALVESVKAQMKITGQKIITENEK